MNPILRYIRQTAALLLTGSAVLFVSCAGQEPQSGEDNTQGMMTQQSENLTVLHSKSGNLNYRFTTPLMERYEMAQEPFTEFRKGVFIETYNDSTHQFESSLRANYAIYLEKQKLWEAKGNVVGRNAKGEQLETEQLFWNEKSKLVYSNVDTKVMRGSDVIYGEGFESDERLENYQMRFPKGKVAVNTAPNEQADSTAAASAPEAGQGDHPVIREGEAVARPKTDAPLPEPGNRKPRPRQREQPVERIDKPKLLREEARPTPAEQK